MNVPDVKQDGSQGEWHLKIASNGKYFLLKYAEEMWIPLQNEGGEKRKKDSSFLF